MQAITVKYLHATNQKGVRLKACVTGMGSKRLQVTVGRDYAQHVADQECEVVRELMNKLGWTGTMIRGHLNETTSVYVNTATNHIVEV